MRWPFSRSRRPSTPAQPVDRLDTSGARPRDKHFLLNYPQNATPRPPTAHNPTHASPADAISPDRASSIRKRRRSPELPFEELGNATPDEDAPRIRRARSRRASDNITALPSSRREDRSPHLRQKSVRRATSVTHKSSDVSLARPISRPEVMTPSDHATPRVPSQKRRLSKRDEHRVKALREDEIRAMSNPMPPQRRYSASADLLNREQKKARRTFSTKAAHDDQRGSNVSLPFQDSIHSSMSNSSDRRGWEIPGMGLLRPRPTMRVAGPSSPQTAGHHHTLSRNDSRKDKRLPAVPEASRKERHRVEDLADDLDATDLRAVLERDTRRKEKKRLQDQYKLEAKLLRRAEKARREEVERATQVAIPPTAIHPALRDATPVEEPSTIGQAPPTPSSDIEHALQKLRGESPDRHDSAAVEQDVFARTTRRDPYRLQDPPDSPLAGPMEVSDEPVVTTAQELRYSQGRMSQISPTPPLSPVQSNTQRTMSPLRSEVTPELASSHSQSSLKHSYSTRSKKMSTWASIFRRDTTSRGAEEPQARSFQVSASPNASQDNVIVQPLPAHLMGNTSRRRSSTRTQSIFREDLPESQQTAPLSPTLPDVLAAGNAAAARRGVARAPNINNPLPPLPAEARPESAEEPTSDLGVAPSLASIDSEGSWLTGRPAKRTSHQSQLRNSVAPNKRREVEGRSHEDLAIPDEDDARRLIPSPQDEQERKVDENDDDDHNLLRRNTSRRRPKVVLRHESAMSSHGFMADVHDGDTPLNGSALASLRTSVDLEHDDLSPGESGSQSYTQQQQNQRVVFGQGHARHISSGSAKLLDIKPRNSLRGSVASTSELSPAPTHQH